MGWPASAIQVVDGDLGISGSVMGQRVLAATVGEDVGVMLSVVVCGCLGMSKAPPGIRGGAFEVRLAVCCSPCRRDRPGVIQR